MIVFLYSLSLKFLKYLLSCKQIKVFLSLSSILFVLLVAILLNLGITGVEYYRILTDRSYAAPSVIYALNEDDEYVPITELYRQARSIISLNNDTESDTNEVFYSRAIRTFIASEDKNFLTHGGIDLQAIFRAAYINIRAGSIKEGASTITQQVARLKFLSRERSFLRKLREMFLAFVLELHYTKREIMEIYVNMLPLGHGTNGIESASQFYFQKSHEELTWGEAALLASLTTRPNFFSPLINPKASRSKVQITLKKLIETGDISIEEAEKEFKNLIVNFYSNLNISPNNSAFHQRLNKYPYISTYVQQELPKKFTYPEILYEGGLKIYTTIRTKHQEQAEKVMYANLQKRARWQHKETFKNHKVFDDKLPLLRMLQHLFSASNLDVSNISKEKRDLKQHYDNSLEQGYLPLSMLSGTFNSIRAAEKRLVERRNNTGSKKIEGALLSFSPTTGQITAAVGGSGFRSNNQQLRFYKIRRQSGSAFKALIYAAALEYSGKNYKQLYEDEKLVLTPATVFDDTPLHFVNSDLSEYSPGNYHSSYEGFVNLRRAITKSKNSVAIQVYQKMGRKNLNKIISEMLSIKENNLAPLPNEAGVALGSYALSPLHLARAYALFANKGYLVEPYVISHITDSKGRMLWDYRPIHEALQSNREQIILPETAQLMHSLLQDVVQKGTGRAAYVPGRYPAGKTGTTNRNTDAWFVGYVPELLTVVYLGYDRPATLGINATGGGWAAPIWGEYMRSILPRRPIKRLKFPNSKLKPVEICHETGMLPHEKCLKKTIELFYPGTEPEDVILPPHLYVKPTEENKQEIPSSEIFLEDELE